MGWVMIFFSSSTAKKSYSIRRAEELVNPAGSAVEISDSVRRYFLLGEAKIACRSQASSKGNIIAASAKNVTLAAALGRRSVTSAALLSIPC